MTKEERLAAVAAMRELETIPMPPSDRGDIIVGDFVFASKAEASSMTRQIIQSVVTTGMTPGAQEFFRALAENHPNIREKVGDRPYTVEPTGFRYRGTSKNVGLAIHFTDIPNWKTDREAYHRFKSEFSTHAVPIGVDACLQTVSHHQRVKSAARMMASRHAPRVRYSTRLFWSDETLPEANLTCAMCDTLIPLDHLHWDHHPHGFVDIFREWRIQMLLRWQDITLDRSNQHRFADVELMRSWDRFHERYANFRPACKKCNITDKEREPLVLSEDDWLDWLLSYRAMNDDRSKHSF
jgi:hypothetical protein